MLLGNAPVHQSKKNHIQILQDPQLRCTLAHQKYLCAQECFSFWQRTRSGILGCLCCRNRSASYIAELDQAQRAKPIQLSQQSINNLLRNQIVEVTVVETSRLQLDPNVAHPFVKVHFVNKKTGGYFIKTEKSQPAVYHTEQNTCWSEENNGNYVACQNDLVLPFSTNCIDFRKEGNSRGVWNQHFYLNEDAANLLSPDTIILFQILDFNPELLKARLDSDLDKDNFYRVAWGFLRPIGVSKKHLGMTRIQLFRYKLRNNTLPDEYRKRNFVPSVYYDFIWPHHQKYDGYLTVKVAPVSRPVQRFTEQLMAPRHLFQLQRADKTYLDRWKKSNTNALENPKAEADLTVNKKLLKYYRVKECVVPQKLIYKFPTAQLGCIRLAMSDTILFCACSERDKTIVKGFSLENHEHLFTFKGHKNIIYAMSLSENSKWLVTAGSDMCMRLWKVPESTAEFIDIQESDAFLLAQCLHPSFVYCAEIFEGTIKNCLMIITGCYDGYVRIWTIDLQGNNAPYAQQIPIREPDILPNVSIVAALNTPAYPCSVATASSFFVVGDSQGFLHVYDIDLGLRERGYRKRMKVTDRELKDDPIICLHILSKSELVIQCRDNVIRTCSLATGQIKFIKSFFGSQSETDPIRSCVSPDKRYLMSGSQEGKPVMWDLLTGDQVQLSHLQLNIEGSITQCVWSNKFNLVAICGFTQECPVFLYGTQVKQQEQQAILALLQKEATKRM